MQLRAFSERKLRQLQITNRWTTAQLVEHLRGDHDGNETHDEEIYDRLSFNGLEDQASKYIPESELGRILSAR
jgi:hypothetical protein